MGLRGLTTYIKNNQAGNFFEDFKLRDCNLVIDAESLCKLVNINTFKWKNLDTSAFAACCYGGDYDKYDRIFREFVKALEECNITPYFLYGGSSCSEKKIERAENRAKSCSTISPDLIRQRMTCGKNMQREDTKGLVYPVGLKYVFRDIMVELGLNVIAISNTDSDNNAAAQLAKALDCPLLGMDSDFFIYGSLYIPILSVNFNASTDDDNWRNKNPSKYLLCKIFKIDKLLNYLQDTNQKCLRYILPVLIGNECHKQAIFTKFFLRNNIGGNERERIAGIFKWLRDQDCIEQAIEEIVESFEMKEEKSHILSQIRDVINEYTPVPVQTILEYFNLKLNDSTENQIVDFEKLRCILKLESVDFTLTKPLKGTDKGTVSALFLERYTNCRYPSFFSKMIRNNLYILSMYIDDFNKPDANVIAYTIIAAIHQILVHDPNKKLTVIQRSKMRNTLEVAKVVLPPCEKALPNIEEIEALNEGARKRILLDILELDDYVSQICKQLSDEWHLFILSILYCRKNTNFDDMYVYALILNFLVLNYVDAKVEGFYRTKSHLAKLNRSSPKIPATEKHLFANMNEADLKRFLHNVIFYFEMSAADTSDTFDRSIMHSLSEFFCVFFHIKHLNNLLNWPFQSCKLSKVYNGTFLYNITKYYKGTRELTCCFKKCRTVYLAFNYVLELIVYPKHIK